MHKLQHDGMTKPIYDRLQRVFTTYRWREHSRLEAFSVARPYKAWNRLTQSLRDITSTTSFKKHLKTQLFNNIFT